MDRVKVFEPNKRQFPNFLEEYGYHTDHSVNPESSNSPNYLSMSSVMCCVGFFGSVNFVFLSGIGENSGIEMRIP